jgi:hypothetical protein
MTLQDIPPELEMFQSQNVDDRIGVNAIDCEGHRLDPERAAKVPEKQVGRMLRNRSSSFAPDRRSRDGRPGGIGH